MKSGSRIDPANDNNTIHDNASYNSYFDVTWVQRLGMVIRNVFDFYTTA